MIKIYCDSCGTEMKRPDDAIRAEAGPPTGKISVFVMPQTEGGHICAACVYDAVVGLNVAETPTGVRLREAQAARAANAAKPRARK